MVSDRVQFITHNGKEILFLNFSSCAINEMVQVIEEAKRAIRTKPEGSVLTLTDVTNARFDETVTQKMKEFTVHNKPYVKAAAVIGVVGIKKIIYEAVLLFSGRKIHVFDKIDDAKNWLATY
jgi:hypothetical protein